MGCGGARVRGGLAKSSEVGRVAFAEVGRIKTYINSIKGKTVTIHVNRAAGTFTAGQGGPTGEADGGTITFGIRGSL